MTLTARTWVEQVDEDGFALLTGVFSPAQVEEIAADLTAALRANKESAIRSEAGNIYAARNLLRTWPAATNVWQVPLLTGVLEAILGNDHGLVRVLYFDKPPNQSWALPWHKDMTIAVRDNSLSSVRFSKPTRKAGVPHVEAPDELLKRMLTARIHLDAVTEEMDRSRLSPGRTAAVRS